MNGAAAHSRVLIYRRHDDGDWVRKLATTLAEWLGPNLIASGHHETLESSVGRADAVICLFKDDAAHLNDLSANRAFSAARRLNKRLIPIVVYGDSSAPSARGLPHAWQSRTDEVLTLSATEFDRDSRYIKREIGRLLSDVNGLYPELILRLPEQADFELPASAPFKQTAQQVAHRLRTGAQIGILEARGRGKTALLHLVASELSEPAVVVRICRGVDAAERALFDIAVQLGDATLAAVDRYLRRWDGLTATLELLGEALRNRRLLVDDLDAFPSAVHSHGADAVTRPRVAMVSRWLTDKAALATGTDASHRLPGERVLLPDAPPFQLQVDLDNADALWADSSRDANLFSLYASAKQISALADNEERDEASVRDAIWQELPQRAHTFMQRLCVHQRPLDLSLLRMLPAESESELGAGVAASLGIVRISGGKAWLDSGWASWCLDRMTPNLRRGAHTVLSRAYDSMARHQDSEHQQAPFLLEATRHYCETGDWRHAQARARHTLGPIFDYANRISIDRHFAEAAEVYGAIINVDATTAQGSLVSPQAKAFSRHYYHYNRYKAEIESVEDTLDGYKKAVDEWPDNALFWSRLIVTSFLAGRNDDALRILEEAEKATANSSQRDSTVFARTAERLLEEKNVEAALHVLDRQPSETIKLRAATELADRVSHAGWQTKRLWSPDGELHLTRSVMAQVKREGEVYIANALPLPGRGEGRNAAEAYSNLIKKVRSRARTLNRTMTHRLLSSDRDEKAKLLAYIDMFASRLVDDIAETTWVTGRVERDSSGGELYFVAGDETSERFQVPHSISQIDYGEDLYLAEIKANEFGEPLGPVVKIEHITSSSSEQIEEEWRRRTAGDD